MKMNRLQLTLVVFLIAMLFPAITFAWEGKVVSVTDGDTIKVLKDGQQVKIRLASIDCPEKGQPYGQKAKQFTADMVTDKNSEQKQQNQCYPEAGFTEGL